MDQKWMNILVILVLNQRMTGAYRVLPPIKQGESADIECHPRDMGTMTIWFRILDKAGMEFIASFSNGIPKNTEGRPSSSFSFSKISKHIVTLQSFDRNKDSGLYSCSSLVKGKELVFGEATRLVGENVEDKPTVAPTTPKQNPVTTATACVCDGRMGETSLLPFCTPLILFPLIGSSGLLLLLLVITILYCNKIRTRRCPHHYKRKPRMMAGGNK